MTDQERNDLVQSVIPWAVIFARRIGRNFLRRVSNDELTSDLWLCLIRRSGTYDPSRGKPTTWASWQVRHYLSHKQQKFSRQRCFILSHRYLSKSHLEEIGFEPDEELEMRDQIEEMRKLFRFLPVKSRQVCKLLCDGVAPTCIAAQMGLSRQRVFQLIHDSIDALRGRIGIPSNTPKGRLRFAAKPHLQERSDKQA